MDNSQPQPKPVLLVVDDNASWLKLCRMSFEGAGWKVCGFITPEAALAQLENIAPDLIITDYRMPGMSGPDFLLAARVRTWGAAVLVVSTYDNEEAIVDSLRKKGLPLIGKSEGLPAIVSAAQKLIAVRRATGIYSAAKM